MGETTSVQEWLKQRTRPVSVSTNRKDQKYGVEFSKELQNNQRVKRSNNILYREKSRKNFNLDKITLKFHRVFSDSMESFLNNDEVDCLPFQKKVVKKEDLLVFDIELVNSMSGSDRAKAIRQHQDWLVAQRKEDKNIIEKLPVQQELSYLKRIMPNLRNQILLARCRRKQASARWRREGYHDFHKHAFRKWLGNVEKEINPALIEEKHSESRNVYHPVIRDLSFILRFFKYEHRVEFRNSASAERKRKAYRFLKVDKEKYDLYCKRKRVEYVRRRVLLLANPVLMAERKRRSHELYERRKQLRKKKMDYWKELNT